MPENNEGQSLESMLAEYAKISRNDNDNGVNQEEVQVANEPENTDQEAEVVNKEVENADGKEDKGISEDTTGGSKEVKPEKLPVEKKDKSSAEKERQDRSWKTYHAKMEEFKKAQSEFEAKTKAEQEKLSAERKSFLEEQERIKKEAEESKASKDTEFTPEQWLEAAERWASQGREEDAKLARQQARIARENQGKANQIKEQKRIEAIKQEAIKYDNKAIEEFPELKDQSSKFYEEVKKVYMGQGDINKLPRGLYLTAQFVKNQMVASEVPELKKKISELQASLEAANKKLTAPSGANSKSSQKDSASSGDRYSEMTLEEKVEAYRKMAREQ